MKDGHHRVSVARAHGLRHRRLRDRGAHRDGRRPRDPLSDLPVKSHERLFFERVPLPPEARQRIRLTTRAATRARRGGRGVGLPPDPGARRAADPREVAERWFRDEYEPVVEMLREADLIGKRTETEAYMAISGLRWRLLRTHAWDEHVIERLREELRLAERSERPSLQGSNSWMCGASIQSSTSPPSVDLGGGVEPRPRSGPPRPRPADRRRRRPRRARELLRLDACRPSTMKWAYSSEPIDSSTSIFVLKVGRGRLRVVHQRGVLEVLRPDARDHLA